MAISTGAALLGSAGISAGSALLGSFIDRFDRSAERQDAINYQRQKEFAQNQLQWRADDARKAGVSAFAALGGQNSFYTPSYSGSSSNFGSAISQAGGAFGDAMQRYALYSQQSALEGQKLENENISLKNELLKSEISNTTKLEGNPTQINAQNDYYWNSGMSTYLNQNMADAASEVLGGVAMLPFVAHSVKQAMTENPTGAFRTFKKAGGILGKVVSNAYQTSDFGVLTSYPVISDKNVKALNSKGRNILASELIDNGLYDNALNAGFYRNLDHIRRLIVVNGYVPSFSPKGKPMYASKYGNKTAER